MRRYIYLALIIEWLFVKVEGVNAQPTNQNPSFGGANALVEVIGEETNSLQPRMFFEKHEADWSVQINFLAQTNFERYTWLKVRNRIGAKLQLWLTNGVELRSTNADLLAATKSPIQSTVADAMRGFWGGVDQRGAQWLRANSGEMSASTSFGLREAFDVSFTNDFTLQITPLLYRVQTNGVTAHLVEFPSMKVKLTSNGKVEKLH